MLGCSSSEDEDAPAACLGGADAYIAALRAAPGEVRLDGETPISDCLTPDQEGGQLAAIGKEMIAAATELNAAAQEEPGGPAALQLGYLVGAVEEGIGGHPRRPRSGGSTRPPATAPTACCRPSSSAPSARLRGGPGVRLDRVTLMADQALGR